MGRQVSRRSLLQGFGASALTAASLPALAACGFGGDSSSGDSAANEISGAFDWKKHSGKKIKLLLNKHPYQEALVADLPKFTQLTGIEVTYDIFPEDNYFDKVTLELRSKQGNYDAFMLGAYMVWQYGPPGYLEDLRPYMNNTAATNAEWDPDDFYPNLLQAGQWNFTNGNPLGGDKQWILPWGFETNTITYNKELFDKLGLRPAETFDELVELSAAIKQKAPGAGYPDMYGIAVRGSKSWATIHPGFMTMYSRFGLKDFTVSGGKLDPQMNSADAVTFTKKWADMVRASGPASWPTYSWYNCSGDLGALKAGMLFDADIAGYFQNTPGSSPAAGKLAWHPGPKGPNGSLATNMWIWSLGMNSAGKNKPATWWFLQWATGKEHLKYGAVEKQHIDPVRKSVAESAEYKQRVGAATGFLDTFSAVIDDSKIQFTPQAQFFDATTSWAEALQKIYGGDDAKSTLDALANDLRTKVNG